MLIRHKGIYKNRMDAPFVGTLISSIRCNKGCHGCINEHLKTPDYQTIDCDEFIKSVVDDPFDKGIILAGLDWTLQSDELSLLVEKALKSRLKVILYTYAKDKDQLLKIVPELSKYVGRGIYVKYGEYDESKRVYNYSSYGVNLATSNQYIELL